MKKIIALFIVAVSTSLTVKAQEHDHNDPNHKHAEEKKETNPPLMLKKNSN